MYSTESQHTGEFEFFVRKNNDHNPNGRLEWAYSSTTEKDTIVIVKLFIHDIELDSSSIDENGKWDVSPIGPITVNMTLAIMRNINIFKSFQQLLLDHVVSKSMDKFPNLREVYGYGTRFISKQHEVKERNENVPLLMKLDMALRKFLGGKSEVDLNATRRAEGIEPNPMIRKFSKLIFCWITSLSGIFTIVLCVNMIGYSNIKTIMIAGAAALTAWAARETALIGSMSRDYDYSFSSHWRGSLWKLIGYASTAMVSVWLVSRFQ